MCSRIWYLERCCAAGNEVKLATVHIQYTKPKESSDVQRLSNWYWFQPACLKRCFSLREKLLSRRGGSGGWPHQVSLPGFLRVPSSLGVITALGRLDTIQPVLRKEQPYGQVPALAAGPRQSDQLTSPVDASLGGVAFTDKWRLSSSNNVVSAEQLPCEPTGGIVGKGEPRGQPRAPGLCSRCPARCPQRRGRAVLRARGRGSAHRLHGHFSPPPSSLASHAQAHGMFHKEKIWHVYREKFQEVLI